MGTVDTRLAFREDMSRRLQAPIRALQTVARHAENVTRRLREVARTRVNPTIAVRDLASRSMNRIRYELLRIGRLSVSAKVALQDRATAIISRIRAGLLLIEGRSVFAIVALRDRATAGLRAIGRLLTYLNRNRARPLVILRDLATSGLRGIRAALLWVGRHVARATVRIRDFARSPLAWIIAQLRRIGSSVVTATVRVRDASRSVIVWTWRQLQNLNSYVATVIINARNLARNAIVWTWRQLQMIGARITTATITVRNLARTGLIWTWTQLRRIGGKVTTTVIDLRNRARTGLLWTWTQIRRIASATPTILVMLRNLATAGLRETMRLATRLGRLVVTIAVRVKDGATAALRMIQRAADKAQGAIMTLVGALGLSLGGVIAQGRAASHSDALTASQSNLYVGNVTSGVDDIYYNGKGGTDREAVAEIYGRVAQQSGQRGDALHRDAALVSKYQALTPDGSPMEITRAFSAMKNSKLDASYERTGDSLAYVRRNGGDQYEDLLDTYNEYATSAAKSNISPEQLANGLVKYQQSGGRNYDNPADALREWGIRSITSIDPKAVEALQDIVGDKETKKMYADLKKSFAEGNGEAGAFDFLAKTQEGLEKIDNPMRKHLAQVALYGTQFEDNDVAVQDFFTGLMEGAKTTGELERAFKQLKASDPATEMMTSWLSLKKVTKDLGVSIITELQPTFKELNDWAKSEEGKKAIDNFVVSVKDLAVALGGALADAIKWTIKNWDKVEPAIIGVGAALISAKTAIPGMITLFKWIKKIFDFLGSPAGKSIGKFIGKVTLLVAAITGLIESFQYVSDSLSFFSTLTDGFSGSGIISAMGAIGTAIGGVIEKFSILNTLKDMEAGKYSDPVPPKKIVSNDKLQDPGNKAYHQFGDKVISQNKKLEKLKGASQGLRRVTVPEMAINVHQDEMILPAAESQMVRDMAAERKGNSNSSSKSTGGNSAPEVNVYVTGEMTFNNGTDEKAFFKKLANHIEEALGKSASGGEAIEI